MRRSRSVNGRANAPALEHLCDAHGDEGAGGVRDAVRSGPNCKHQAVRARPRSSQRGCAVPALAKHCAPVQQCVIDVRFAAMGSRRNACSPQHPVQCLQPLESSAAGIGELIPLQLQRVGRSSVTCPTAALRVHAHATARPTQSWHQPTPPCSAGNSDTCSR